MQTLFDNWLGWLGLGATAATVISLLSWVPGIGIALRIFASGLEIASPVINGILSGLIWIWGNILFPGLKGIFSSVSVTLTVATIFAGYYFFDKANDSIKYNNLQRQCVAIKQKRPTEDVPQEPLWEFKFPWQ